MTKPSYEEVRAERDHNIARADAWYAKWKQSEAENLRVRGLLQRAAKVIESKDSDGWGDSILAEISKEQL